ncbi:type II toxin-antitoxin system prevent-host-death family antitoxin [Neisseria sp. 19428wB4_WF04]|nr:type II toxin-antitoxin system prevent-host-death family antitoxin [Neisseria sp. 19428wB4_WF04]
MTSRKFNHYTTRAMREADSAPLVITNRGKPAHVLLSYDDYRQLAGRPKSALDVLMQIDSSDAADIELEIPPRSQAQRRNADLGE